MKPATYFNKYHCIYGISEKFEFGQWTGYAEKFDDLDRAEKWLNQEEYDFRIRTLCSKSKAKKYLK